jgi:Zn-dependent protease/CBS domain-containing protein
LVARWSGIRVPAITLFLFGGVSHMEEEARTPGDELRVAAVGPFTSFALAGVFLGLYAALPFGEESLTGAVVLYLGYINAALGIFNLLPGYPLDGGRVLRAVAWWRTGDLRRATRVAADAGKGLAVGLMILGGLEIFAGALLGGVWLILIGLFLRSMAEGGYQNLVLLQTLEDVSAGDVAVRDVVTVPSDTDVATFVDEYLLGHGFHAFPVADGATVRGLASVEDVREVPADKRPSTSVDECMRPLSDDLRVAPDVPLARAMKQLAQTPGGRLLVMDGDRLVGLLTKSGLARFVEIRRVLEAS